MIRQLDIDTITLEKGSHTPDHTFCVMEAVAYVAGETWSDAPGCTSPVIAAYCRTLNDRWDDGQRQTLKPYIVRLVGTRNPALEERRMFMCADAAVRVFAPLALEAAGLVKAARTLRLTPPIVDPATARAAYAAADAAAYATAAYAAADAAAYATAAYAALELLDRLIEVQA